MINFQYRRPNSPQKKALVPNGAKALVVLLVILAKWIIKKAATYSSSVEVPLAHPGLTALFGMGRGDPRG